MERKDYQIDALKNSTNSHQELFDGGDDDDNPLDGYASCMLLLVKEKVI